MTDIVSKETRSRMMSGIRCKNTRPELAVRKELFRRGIRYQLHMTNLPGKPDLVLKKYGAVIFVHGCFWHGHSCELFKMPGTNSAFWSIKIKANQENDRCNIEKLLVTGWRVFTVWECSLRGKSVYLEKATEYMIGWLKSDAPTGELTGESVLKLR